MAIPNKPPTPGITGRLPLRPGSKLTETQLRQQMSAAPSATVERVKQTPDVTASERAILEAANWKDGDPWPSGEEIMKAAMSLQARPSESVKGSGNNQFMQTQAMTDGLQDWFKNGMQDGPATTVTTPIQTVSPIQQPLKPNQTRPKFIEPPAAVIEPEPVIETTQDLPKDFEIEYGFTREDAVDYLRSVLSATCPFTRTYTGLGGKFEIVFEIKPAFVKEEGFARISGCIKKLRVDGYDVITNLNNKNFLESASTHGFYPLIVEYFKKFEVLINALTKAADNHFFWTAIAHSPSFTKPTSRDA